MMRIKSNKSFDFVSLVVDVVVVDDVIIVDGFEVVVEAGVVLVVG